MSDQLTTTEKQELVRCEETIEAGLKTFYEVGKALLKIRDMRLYRAEYPTFEAYCQDRWGISRNRAYQNISAVQIVDQISPTSLSPTSDTQVRPLLVLPEGKRRIVWEEVIADAKKG